MTSSCCRGSALLGAVPHAVVTGGDGSFAVARPEGGSESWLTVLPRDGSLALEVQVTGREPVDLVIPAGQVGAGGPAIRVVADRELRLIVVRGGSQRPAVVLQSGEAFTVELATPSLVDVTVRRVGEPTLERNGWAVLGPVELVL